MLPTLEPYMVQGSGCKKALEGKISGGRFVEVWERNSQIQLF